MTKPSKPAAKPRAKVIAEKTVARTGRSLKASKPIAKTAVKAVARKPRAPRTTDAISHFKTYSENLSKLMASYDWAPVAELADDFARIIKTRHQLFICGNGGSAGNANHLTNDFIYGVSKNPGHALRVISLSANPAVLTCLANDEGYDRIYEIQLRELANKGDILIVFSGSGNSPNILKVLEAAKALGVKSYAVLGYSGGKAKAMCDVPIHFAINDMQISEDMQGVVGHMLMQWLWDNRTAISGTK